MKLIGIVIYLIILMMIGVIASRRMKDLRDYYAGGKNFGFLGPPRFLRGLPACPLGCCSD